MPATSYAPRLPRGFHQLVATQFLSALADNALLIVTIALLSSQGRPAWWAPLLKVGFNASYVVLAPFIGALADSAPKCRMMSWMNGCKVLGICGLMGGLEPVAAFTIVGFGAAGYAPAKYGLVTELVAPEQLVPANGWLEVSVVCAALLGAVFGGVLVSPLWLDSSGHARLLALTPGLPTGALAPSLLLVLALYLASAAMNLRVPDSGARYAASSFHPHALWQDFWRDQRTLWRDADGGLSLAATTIFWGLGATLQFAVLRWAAEGLGLSLDKASFLQAVVAIGVIAGAGAAGRWVPLSAAKRMLVFGVMLGLLMPVIAMTTALPVALALLLLVGAVGGLLVVPLNALLQHRGLLLMGAGRSIAVQGFNENASVLVMLALYAGLSGAGVELTWLMASFGFAIALGIARLMWRASRPPLPTAESH